MRNPYKEVSTYRERINKQNEHKKSKSEKKTFNLLITLNFFFIYIRRLLLLPYLLLNQINHAKIKIIKFKKIKKF